MVAEKSSGSWVTSANWARTDSTVASSTSTPSRQMRPEAGRSNLKSNAASVLFPLPDSPTSAATCPTSSLRLSPRSAGRSAPSVEGQAKHRASHLISRCTGPSASAPGLDVTPWGNSSTSSMRSRAAPAPRAKWLTRPRSFAGWYRSTRAPRKDTSASASTERLEMAKPSEAAMATEARISISAGTPARAQAARSRERLTISARWVKRERSSSSALKACMVLSAPSPSCTCPANNPSDAWPSRVRRIKRAGEARGGQHRQGHDHQRHQRQLPAPPDGHPHQHRRC